MPSNEHTKFSELKKVFAALHGPKGCLWDKKQTYASLIPHFREEAGEFIEAIRGKNYPHMKEELGDILLFVMFYSQIASKNKHFDVEEVIDGLIQKLKRRHPHVFGNVKVNSRRQIIANWNRIKSLEKGRKG
ncbi:MAG TPA: MazG nucleotide pyrophosphohydrolase domain-containing protein [Patescibacteria group bacterium]|nr:MazG nucleotide pyrophosphohydrolase domain-containing protein [Patescibacteria group bacterium]